MLTWHTHYFISGFHMGRFLLTLLLLGMEIALGFAVVQVSNTSQLVIALGFLGVVVFLATGGGESDSKRLAGLCGCLGLVAIYLSISRQQLGFILVAILLWIAAAVFFYESRRGRWDLFSALSFAVAIFLLAFGFKGAEMLLTGADDLLVSKALLLVDLGFICFLAGYYAKLGKSLAYKLNPLPSRWPETRVKVVSFILIMVSLVTYLWLIWIAGFSSPMDALRNTMLFRRRIEAGGIAYFRYIMQLGMVIPLLLRFLTLQARERVRLSEWLVFALWLIVVMLVFLPLAMRGLIVSLAISMLAIRHHTGKRVRLGVLPLFAFPSGFYLVVTGLYRSLSLSQDGTATLLDATSYALGQTTMYFYDFVFGWFNAFPVFVRIVDQISADQFIYGATVVSMLLRPIPRVWFPGKPVETGTLITRLLYPDVAAAQVALNPSLFGEMYINLGVVGIIFGLTVLGMLTRLLDEYFARFRNKRGVILYHAMIFSIIGGGALLAGFDSTWIIEISLFTFVLLVVTRVMQGRHGGNEYPMDQS